MKMPVFGMLSTQRIAEEINVSELALADALRDAYERYDSDARVNGPDDAEAFTDAVRDALAQLLIQERS